jgi:protocatechuate 3,4-dioxygenase beta subunit
MPAATAAATIAPAATVAVQDLPAPACTPGQATPAQTEGPYWKDRSPERTSLLEAGMAGTRLVITGYVLTGDCRPIAGALLDFWQADAQGAYDNAGFRLRGHQFTDAQGRYTLETVVPGEYPGRTEHIHVKVQAPGGPVLTSQLYFPGGARNDSDGIFDASLVMQVQETAGGMTATFDFVMAES